jgi:MoxR-like ATPase
MAAVGDAAEIRERISAYIREGLPTGPTDQARSRTDAHWRTGLNPELAALLGVPVEAIATKTLNKPGSVASRFQGAAFDPRKRARGPKEPVELGVFIYHASRPDEFDPPTAVRYGADRLSATGVRALAYFVPTDSGEWTLSDLVTLANATAARHLANVYPDVQVSEVIAESMPVEPVKHFVLFQRSDPEYRDVIGRTYHFTDESSGAYRQLSAVKNARFIYYRPGRSPDGTGQTFFGAGLITNVDTEMNESHEEWTANLVDYQEFDRPIPATELPSLHQQNSIQVISKPDFDRIVALAAGDAAAQFTFDELREAVIGQGLLMDDAVIANAFAALESGRHIVLTGPPGTAKTTLAQTIATLAQRSGRSRGTVLTTATADWTTFETIGGLRPSDDGRSLVFSEGHFLRAIEDDAWLVIDELNRSNFDRAFGQLFTVLSGQAVTLPYTRGVPPRPIAVVPEGADTPLTPDTDVIAVSRDWRIVATMNVFDKSLLFEMSYALMRRFAFVEVPAPPDEDTMQLIEDRAGDSEAALALTAQFLAVRAVKDLGPAVFMDLASFLRKRLELATNDAGQAALEGFYGFLLPQFEGLDRERAERLFRIVARTIGETQRPRLVATLESVLGVEVRLGAHASADLDREDDTDADL